MFPFVLHGEISWSAWQLEPTIIGAALVVLGVYVYGLSKEPSFDLPRALLFLAGTLSMLT